ncbi:2174_t:CDS:10 [Funneliformis caledonium]|uniref:Mediator of RNA polymerase II transcription subunit 25 n=2 Tax=Funneliformis TaxID=1117308 RepID=A0A9N8V965_9GLOM|nr:2174_t:CDS:10 [Funneliformis caledonium]
MPQKINKETSLECLVIIVLDGSYLLEDHFETIFDAYLEPILKHMKLPILIEQEDKDKNEIQKEKITPKLKSGLVIFGNYEPISRSPVTTYYFEENLSQFEKLIKSIEFEDGGMRENAVAEGLVAALEMFDAYKSQTKSENLEPRKHCLLISNSHPCPDLVHRNIDEKYDQFSMNQIVEEMKKQNIHLSLITPERNFTKLEELVTEVNQDIEVHNAADVINSSHVVKLAGFKPLFTHPKEVSTAIKRKREDSTSSIGTVEKPKKVKLEPTQDPVKGQSTAPNGLPVQLAQPLQAPASNKKDQITATQNSPVQQHPSSQPPVVNTATPAHVPMSQTPAVTNATLPNTNALQSSPNALAHIQQPVKTANQVASSIVATMHVQPSATSTTAISQSPLFIQQQSIPGSIARPQQNMPGVKYPPNSMTQFNMQLAAMTPEQRKHFIANLKNQPPFRNAQFFRNTLATNAQQQLIRQNTILQHELAASQQNLANVFRRQMLQFNNGTQVNIGQQPIGGNFATSATINEAASSQSLNGTEASSAATTAQQLSAFNSLTSPMSISTNSQSVGYTTASTSIGAQFRGQMPTSSIGTVNAATIGAQLPASTMMSSTSTASMNNSVIGQSTKTSVGVATSINGNLIRPSIASSKTINALWNGQIMWSSSNQHTKIKRELTCRVTAFPVTNKKPTQTQPQPQPDYMISCWPEKMEISGINNVKDVVNVVSSNPRVLLLPTPTPPSTQENNNSFAILMRTLDTRKMAAFVRFPNAPNPNGGIVLYPTGQKIVGLLFLDTPLPTSVTVASQAQQFRPPQAQQPTMQMPTAAQVLQQNAFQHIHQQQQMQALAHLQQQSIANLPPNMQQALMLQQQQRQAMQPALLQNLQVGSEQALLRRRMANLFQTASNANTDINNQQMLDILRTRQSSQQPTQ